MAHIQIQPEQILTAWQEEIHWWIHDTLYAYEPKGLEGAILDTHLENTDIVSHARSINFPCYRHLSMKLIKWIMVKPWSVMWLLRSLLLTFFDDVKITIKCEFCNTCQIWWNIMLSHQIFTTISYFASQDDPPGFPPGWVSWSMVMDTLPYIALIWWCVICNFTWPYKQHIKALFFVIHISIICCGLGIEWNKLVNSYSYYSSHLYKLSCCFVIFHIISGLYLACHLI